MEASGSLWKNFKVQGSLQKSIEAFGSLWKIPEVYKKLLEVYEVDVYCMSVTTYRLWLGIKRGRINILKY